MRVLIHYCEKEMIMGAQFLPDSTVLASFPFVLLLSGRWGLLPLEMVKVAYGGLPSAWPHASGKEIPLKSP